MWASFGEKIFKNPKPVDLIKDFIRIGSNENDIVLDFFAGSGTTGDAVIQLNNETKKERKFILVEQLDYVENVTCKRVKDSINNFQTGIKICISDTFIYLSIEGGAANDIY